MSRARKRSGGSFSRRLAWDRPDHVERSCRDAAGRDELQGGARPRRLARIDAEAAFKWRQGAAGEDLEDGQPRRQWSLEPVAQPQATRRLLYLGAMATITARRRKPTGDDWLWGMMQRKPVKLVAIALANRMARTVWALLKTGESYRASFG